MWSSPRLERAVPRRRFVLRLVSGGLALGLFGCGTATPAAPTRFGTFLTATEMPAGLTGRPVPRFPLADAASGGLFQSSSLRGRPYAVAFLYTRCPDVCPLIAQEIRSVLGELGADARKKDVVAVSVDPLGDKRGAVRAWLAHHNEPANFHYLIGTRRQLTPVWKFSYAAPQIPGDPQSSHTATIWLFDRHGRLKALIAAGIAINVANLAHDFRLLIHEK